MNRRERRGLGGVRVGGLAHGQPEGVVGEQGLEGPG